MIAALALAAGLAVPLELAIYSHNVRVDYRGEGWARRNGPNSVAASPIADVSVGGRLQSTATFLQADARFCLLAADS